MSGSQSPGQHAAQRSLGRIDFPIRWNWLAIEYEDNPAAKLIHYTLGTPCFKDYADTSMSDRWHAARDRVNDGMGV